MKTEFELIELDIQKKFMVDLRKNLSKTNSPKLDNPLIIKNALSLYSWAVQEAVKGRVILSSFSDGKNLYRLEMEELTRLS